MVQDPQPTSPLGHAISQPVVYSSPAGTSTPLAIYATPQGFVGAAPAASLRNLSPMVNMDMSETTFRLHTEMEPPSKLDPALELNTNLTNWGMTYTSGKQSRKTWDNSTFVKDQLDSQVGVVVTVRQVA